MSERNSLILKINWVSAIAYSLLLFSLLSGWVILMNENIACVILIFLIVPLIQFLATPIFTMTRVYNYLSPMVVSFGNNKNILDLHNGTSFDYLAKMKGVEPGIQWKKTMLRFYLEALLTIIHKIKNGDLDESSIIRGSSYFLSKRSADKLGFKTSKTSMAEKVNIALNYLDLIWMYSLSDGQLVFPNLNNIMTVSILGKDLVNHEQRIRALCTKLSRSN